MTSASLDSLLERTLNCLQVVPWALPTLEVAENTNGCDSVCLRKPAGCSSSERGESVCSMGACESISCRLVGLRSFVLAGAWEQRQSLYGSHQLVTFSGEKQQTCDVSCRHKVDSLNDIEKTAKALASAGTSPTSLPLSLSLDEEQESP